MGVHHGGAGRGLRGRRLVRGRPLKRGGAVRQMPLMVRRMRQRRLALQLRRQSLRIARSAAEREEMDFLEAVQADNPLDD